MELKYLLQQKQILQNNNHEVTTIYEKEGGKYEAGFKKNGNIMSALFEADGTMTESEVDIKVFS